MPKTPKSRLLLRRIRDLNAEIKLYRKHRQDPLCKGALIECLNERADLVIQYIKSLKTKTVSVKFLRTLLV